MMKMQAARSGTHQNPLDLTYCSSDPMTAQDDANVCGKEGVRLERVLDKGHRCMLTVQADLYSPAARHPLP